MWRTRLLIQTLNPLLFAHGYTWQRDVEEIEEFQATHAGRNSPQYQDSPFAAIIKGEGGIRRRLEGDNARLDFPILTELVEEGATDYVAVPMRFSDGQINILVLVSDAPGGFRTDQLSHLYQILANLSACSKPMPSATRRVRCCRPISARTPAAWSWRGWSSAAMPKRSMPLS